MKHLTLLRGHLVLIQPTDRQYNKIHGVHAAVKPLQTVRRRVVDGSNVNFFSRGTPEYDTMRPESDTM